MDDRGGIVDNQDYYVGGEFPRPNIESHSGGGFKFHMSQHPYIHMIVPLG